MQTKRVAASVAALVLGSTGLWAQDVTPQVQRRSVTQETYSASGSTASVVAPSPAPVQAQAPTAVSSSTVAAPLAQQTITTEETIFAKNNPPLRWSVLEGDVTHVDKVNNVVEIRLKGSKNMVGIPVVERRVAIYRHGDHQYGVQDIEPGDSVTIRNLETTSPTL